MDEWIDVASGHPPPHSGKNRSFGILGISCRLRSCTAAGAPLLRIFKEISQRLVRDWQGITSPWIQCTCYTGSRATLDSGRAEGLEMTL